MIVGGFSEEYPTHWAARDSVHTLLKGMIKIIPSGPVMKCNDTTNQPLHQPHANMIIVTIKNGQINVRRVLVDTGSTTDITTKIYLRQMKYKDTHIKPIDRPLIFFRRNRVLPQGTIILSIHVRDKRNSRIMAIRFTVVDIRFLCNAVSGLPLIKKNQSRHIHPPTLATI